jgi:formylglycine-generating enzyme
MNRSPVLFVLMSVAAQTACSSGAGSATQPAAAQGDDSGNGEDSGNPGSGSGTCPATCGPSGSESCCTSNPVSGGTFYRGYNGVADSVLDCCTSKAWPATVSDFRLDRFEVTVGRFREFVGAVLGKWVPAAGAGKHTHLNGGQGLVDAGSDAGVTYETGWDPSWNAQLAKTSTQWDANLACDSTAPGGPGTLTTWTPSPGDNENLPINCVTWWEAYAFCIWDGAFLPSTAEWLYAAGGGSQQRVYAWSSQSIDCTSADVDNCWPAGANVVGAYSPKGDGLFGQADLVGNVSEWALDWGESANYGYPTPCVDCALLTQGVPPGNGRKQHGASFDETGNFDESGSFAVADPTALEPQLREIGGGMRCARTP